MRQLLISTLLFASISVLGQKGIIFPTIKGESLNNKPMTIPENNGKYSVVSVAFSRSAEEDLKKWINPLFQTFIKVEDSEQSGGFDLADVYDVNFSFVPIIAGFGRAAADFKKGTDKQFWQYILNTENLDVKALQQELKVTDSKIPYFYVLDKDGKVVEVQSGSFSEAKLEKLEAAID